MGEMMRIFPDALIWGIGFLALLTASFPFGVFFVSLFESLAIYYGLQSFNNWIGLFTDSITRESANLKCRTGFASITIQSLSLFGSERTLAFPSAPVYILSVAVSYILSMLITFKNNLQVLGTDFVSRLYLSAIGLLSTLFLLMAYRSLYKCDTLVVIILSLLSGLVVGAVILQQNKLLFGSDGINMLGIPLLYNGTADGSPMYVCNRPAPSV
jgi:hypothetical protein